MAVSSTTGGRFVLGMMMGISAACWGCSGCSTLPDERDDWLSVSAGERLREGAAEGPDGAGDGGELPAKNARGPTGRTGEGATKGTGEWITGGESPAGDGRGASMSIRGGTDPMLGVEGVGSMVGSDASVTPSGLATSEAAAGGSGRHSRLECPHVGHTQFRDLS